MGYFCVICLSFDRKLFAFKEYLPCLQGLSDIKTMKRDSKICWECKAVIRKFLLLKEKIKKTQKLLKKIPIENIKNKCMSDLNIRQIEITTYPEPKSLITDILIENSVILFASSDKNDITEKNNFPDKDLYDIEIKPELWDTDVQAEDFDFKEELFEPIDDVPLAQRPEIFCKKRKKDLKKSKKVKKNHERTAFKNEQITEERFATMLVTEEQASKWRLDDLKNEKYLKPPFKCNHCIIAYYFEDQLQQHNLKFHHESLGEILCDVCLTRFMTQDDMLSHRQCHMTLYQCLKCHYEGRSEREINRHYVMEHGVAAYECRECNMTFKTSSLWRYHRDGKHGKRWPCKFCTKTFRLRNNMYSHMIIHKKLPPATCHICKKVMKSKYALKIHLKIHEEQKKTYFCQMCNSLYKTEAGYKNHLNTSMKHLTPDKLKYACDECGRRFLTEKRQKRHYNSVHLKKSEFQCDQCDKSYSTQLSLRQHFSKKHDGTYTGPAKDKICDICGKGFAVNGVLRAHMRTHTGEKPFKCTLCTSTFAHQAALYTHTRLVHLKLKRKKGAQETSRGFPA